MSLKKRMFRSNMTILFLSLISLFAVAFLVVVVFEDSIERRFWTMKQQNWIMGYCRWLLW